MSNDNTAAEGRTFKTVNGKESTAGADGGKAKGELKFVRPKQLAAEGVTGIVAEGVYEGTLPNKFDENKPDYKIRAAGDTLIVINSTGSLASQMKRVELGSYVQIIYKGMVPMTSGKMAGKKSHSFIVLIAD